jgi:hypothetical protein
MKASGGARPRRGYFFVSSFFSSIFGAGVAGALGAAGDAVDPVVGDGDLGVSDLPHAVRTRAAETASNRVFMTLLPG